MSLILKINASEISSTYDLFYIPIVSIIPFFVKV